MKKKKEKKMSRPEYRTVFVGSDHAGYEYADLLMKDLSDKGYNVIDCIEGRRSKSDDYPDRVFDFYRAMVREGFSGEGILFCASGEGVSMSANKLPGIRAVEIRDITEAKKSREHNNANVLCLGSQEFSYEALLEVVVAWLSTPASHASRHKRRQEKVQRLEYAASTYSTRKQLNSRVIPAILTNSSEEFSQKLHSLYGLVRWVQIDVLDDSSFSGRTILPYEMSLFEWPFLFEAHLMVENPMKYIDACKRAGFSRIIFHHETDEDSDALIEAIRFSGMEVGIALNPKTPLTVLEPYLKKIDRVLLLGVNPGQSGQTMKGTTEKRVHVLRNRVYRSLPIAVDGGVNEDTLRCLVTSGVDSVCVSSFLFRGEGGDREKKIRYLESFFEQ